MQVSDTLTERARDLMVQHPHLTAQRAYQVALERDPALAVRHHRGEADPAPPPPPAAVEPEATDPGAAMLAAIGAKMTTGMSRGDAEAAVFRDYPLVAEAWHRGALIRKTPAAPTSGKVGPPAAIFRAPMAFRSTADFDEDPVEGVIKEVDIFAIGEWNGAKYDSKSLDALVSSFDHLGYRPPVTLSHGAKEDALAHGYVSKLYRRGNKVLADLAGVPPETMQAIREGRILSVSAEIFIGYRRNGRTFPYALRALSLLGAHPPGVDLRPIAESLPKLEI